MSTILNREQMELLLVQQVGLSADWLRLATDLHLCREWLGTHNSLSPGLTQHLVSCLVSTQERPGARCSCPSLEPQ